MLELQDFKNLTKDDILKLLEEQNSTSLEIAVPKETKEFFSERFAISIDYGNLAYAGQRLSELATDFQYSKVPPSEHESAIFTVTVSDLALLAETLLEISYGYVNDPEDEDFSFDEMVEDFLYQVDQEEVTPACPYFIEIYKEYMDEEENQ